MLPMTRNPPEYIIDSSALLAICLNEPEAEKMEWQLIRAREGKSSLFLSVVQYGEILYIIEQRKGVQRRDEIREYILALPISFIPVNRSIAEEAAHIKAQGDISYLDAFAIGAAIDRHATILTKDREFRKFSKEVSIEWLSS